MPNLFLGFILIQLFVLCSCSPPELSKGQKGTNTATSTAVTASLTPTPRPTVQVTPTAQATMTPSSTASLAYFGVAGEKLWSFAAVASNGAFDNTRPMANSVYDPDSNTSFATYMGGTSATNAGIYVFSYNHTTKTQYGPIPVFIFSENATTHDGHSYPQIVKSHDGHIHIFFVNQSSVGGVDPHRNYHIRFSEPGTIQTAFTTDYLKVGGNGLFGRSATSAIQGEYPQAFVARDGTMYYFTRAVLRNNVEPNYVFNGKSYRVAYRPQIFTKSTDHGLTWSPFKEAISRMNLTDFLTEPYLSQVIAEPARDGVPERFHFTWTLAAGMELYYDANNNLIYDYHNGFSKNIYHAYFTPSTDKFYSMDGTDLGEAIDGTEMDAKCAVVITGYATMPSVPMSTEQNAYLFSKDSQTSIAGNISTIDDQGQVIVNGKYLWTGSSWLNSGSFPSDTRFAHWREGFYYAYRQNAGVYKSANGLSNWTLVGSLFDDAAGVNKLPSTMRSASGTAYVSAALPSHPEARFWYKKYGSSTYSGYTALGGHRSSLTPQKILATVNEGTISPGESFTLNAYIVDEWGARVMDAALPLTIETNLTGNSLSSTNTQSGKGSLVITSSSTTKPGEYKITVKGENLQSSTVYVTVK